MGNRSSKAVACYLGLLMVALSTAAADSRPWSAGTAQILPRGRWEKGLFQALRYGQTERLEWATNPLLNLVVPNMRLKVTLRQVGGWDLAVRYSFHYPTPLLRLLRREGIGGVIAPDPDIPKIPAIFSQRGELLATRALNTSLLLTGRVGISAALKTSELDERTTIDIPAVYPRMAVYYHGYQLNLGLRLDADLPGGWACHANTGLLAVPGAEESSAFEIGGWLAWSRGERFRIVFGYLLTYGAYPFGTQWQLLPYPLAFGPGWKKVPLPMVELQWGRQRKGKR